MTVTLDRFTAEDIGWLVEQHGTHYARAEGFDSSFGALVESILQDFAAAFGERMARNVARAGRAGTPGEIADIIVFLASPESNWIKGQDICIDGGMSAMAGSDMMGIAEPSDG